MALPRLAPIVTFLCWVALVVGAPTHGRAGPGGKLQLEVVDRDTNQPIACRMHLTNAAHRPLKAPKVPFWHRSFCFFRRHHAQAAQGAIRLRDQARPGISESRGGHFIMDDFSEDTQEVDLKRVINMAAEGWWSGDLDVRRPAKDLPSC